MLTRDMALILNDPSASDWLKQTLLQALKRDPVDAANDAEILHQLLERRAEDTLVVERKDFSYDPVGAYTE